MNQCAGQRNYFNLQYILLTWVTGNQRFIYLVIFLIKNPLFISYTKPNNIKVDLRLLSQGTTRSSNIRINRLGTRVSGFSLITWRQVSFTHDRSYQTFTVLQEIGPYNLWTYQNLFFYFSFCKWSLLYH